MHTHTTPPNVKTKKTKNVHDIHPRFPSSSTITPLLTAAQLIAFMHLREQANNRWTKMINLVPDHHRDRQTTVTKPNSADGHPANRQTHTMTSKKAEKSRRAYAPVTNAYVVKVASGGASSRNRPGSIRPSKESHIPATALPTIQYGESNNDHIYRKFSRQSPSGTRSSGDVIDCGLGDDASPP